MQYHWNERSRYPRSADPQTVGDWLERIKNRRGTLNAEVILEEASRRQSPIHDLVTWVNATAAHQHRLTEVRKAVANLRISREGESVRAFLPVRRPDQPTSYETYDAVMRNSRLRQQRLQLAYRQLESYRERWASFRELRDVLRAIETVALTPTT